MSFTDYEIIKLILKGDPIQGVIQDFKVSVTTLQYHRNAVGYFQPLLSGFTCTYIQNLSGWTTINGMLGLVVCQPSEMVNHFFPAPPAPPAKPPDRDKLIINWLDSPSLEEEPAMPSRLCARNHILPRPSTRYNKPYGLTRPSCLVLTLAVNLLVNPNLCQHSWSCSLRTGYC